MGYIKDAPKCISILDESGEIRKRELNIQFWKGGSVRESEGNNRSMQNCLHLELFPFVILRPSDMLIWSSISSLKYFQPEHSKEEAVIRVEKDELVTSYYIWPRENIKFSLGIS